MTSATRRPASQNEGYFGTIRHATREGDAAWAGALAEITKAIGCAPDEAATFLDSRYGRNFADDVANYLHARATLDAAIEQTVACWMGWRISKRTARETGIPAGLPHLTGFVRLAGSDAEAGC